MPAPVSSKRSTIKDVAAEAGVSISTVSIALNGKGYVSASTRDRVLAAAKRLGYAPRRAARQLATRRTGNVGFVLREDHFTRSEPFYTRIFLGAEFEARNQGCYVLLTVIPESYRPGLHTPRFLREGNVDGLLVAGRVDVAFLDEVAALGLPFMLIDFEAAAYPALSIDNQGGARAAVDHLVRQGHERIALLGADPDHPSIAARIDGYRLALGAAGRPVDEGLILLDAEHDPTRATGRALAERLLDSSAPTAVFCVNDALALAVLDVAQARGVAVPGDLAVVGFDDVDAAVHATPPLTTVRVFKEQLGELALRTLCERLNALEEAGRFDRGSPTIRIPTELVVRASG